MKDYSIEHSISKINSIKTREYFKEVASSYYNENYRAAVVTLYSIVIIDIILKLENLSEIHLDNVATDILTEMKKSQKNNPNNPDWENELIEKVKLRTSLIDNVDSANIESLRSHRHLSAHPVINKDDKLYTPNKETVASHIRNMMESLFLKPAFFSKKILSTVLTDIAEKKEIFVNTEVLNKYVTAKYLNNLHSETEVQLFRGLWKITFKLINQDAEDNRGINYDLLKLLYVRNISECIKAIKAEKEYYSTISDTGACLYRLIVFLAQNEFLYNELRVDVHALVLSETRKSPNVNALAWFVSETMSEHLDKLKILIKNDFEEMEGNDASTKVYHHLIKICLEKGYDSEIKDFIIWRYENSRNFNDADWAFAEIIKPNLKLFMYDDFILLCDKCSRRDQVCSRRLAKSDHKELKEYIEDNISQEFTFKDYPWIFNS